MHCCTLDGTDFRLDTNVDAALYIAVLFLFVGGCNGTELFVGTILHNLTEFYSLNQVLKRNT